MKKYIITLLSIFSSAILMAQLPDPNASPVIYEVNVRQYSEEGSFNKVFQNLVHLKMLGVNILWIMPIHPIGIKNRKGTLGNYYSVKDYRGINIEFGDSVSFKRLVNAAHGLGMKVIIDWVANQTAWDHAWIKQHPDWYVRNKRKKIQSQYDWVDVAKLDYTNLEMRKAMISDMQYWVDNFDIDGFRCDLAYLIPQDFWEQARAQLERKKPMYMLADMEWNTDITPSPNTYFDKVFNTSYGMNFMNTSQSIAKGTITLNSFRKEIQQNYRKFPAKMTKLFFITNNNENSFNGTVKEKYGRNWKLYATLCYTLPKSIPLIYSGEEVGLNRRLSAVEKDPITQSEWNDTNRLDWYRSIIALRHSNKALWNTNTTPPIIEELNFAQNDSLLKTRVFAFKRKADNNEVIVITNFSNNEVQFEKSMLTIDPEFKMLFDHHQFFKNAQEKWVLKANENVILYK